MAVVEIVEETFILTSRHELAVIIADERRWRQWWPGLQAALVVDRGLDGSQWELAGDLVGTVEIALDPSGNGVVLRYRLYGDPTPPTSSTDARRLSGSPRARRTAASLNTAQVLRWKQTVWALKTELEDGRSHNWERRA